MDKYKHILACPVCGNENFKAYMKTKDFFLTQEEFTLSQCDNCGMVFTNPIPVNIDSYYETTNYLSHNTKDNGLIGKLYSELRKINIKRKYKLVQKFCEHGNFLDIGCGTGELLYYFKQNNWNVTGVEPNKTARAFANNNYKINILEEIELDHLQQNSFDIISMWHVLEHVPNLDERLNQVSKLLKPDGTIFIALPNINSPDSKKYGRYWSALDVPRHLYHFTESTLKKLIAKHNMKLINSEPMKFDSYYVSMLSEKYMKNNLYLPAALINGIISNMRAKKSNKYSSMIYVVKI